MRNRPLVTGLLIAAAIGWVGGLIIGLRAVGRYQVTPGPALSDAGRTWPALAPPLAEDAPTLVMFLHPQCPCSQATLASLNQILAHANGPLRAYIFAVIPPGAPDEWRHSPLLEQAAALAGVQMVADQDGQMARQFGALTSGHTALYSPQGLRLFSGGITPSRGHEGDNAGIESVEALLMSRSPKIVETPIFGCTLLSPD